MFAAASALFARTNISQNYVINPSTSTPSTVPGLPAAPTTSPFKAGLWSVQPAQHKLNNKRVSVWSLDKRSPEMERLGAVAKERVIELLKAEATALGRLRHPSVLEMVEPLEETRLELTFATEPLLSTLQQAIPMSSRGSESTDLDEIEIQKGILQLSKGLAFLHTSAKLVHTNITPYTVLINVAGDWKLSGLAHTIPLIQSDGSAAKWEFPEYHSSLPSYIQRNLDYMAPEYALDEQIATSSDMYSLGCVLYTVHNKGIPPFRNHSSLSTMRSNFQSGMRLAGMESWDPDLRALLSVMISRTTVGRPSPETIGTNSFFNSLPISTLNFLERSNFASKSREEKIAFMKGLTGVLDRFSESLRSRKILPSLLEEMKDPFLLPSILPNVFAISTNLSPSQFASQVLPSLKPLFVVKDPPQNMITLLENLSMLQSKTDKQVFREHVLPLVYNALESEHAIVQERALKVVPDLCESIDYAEVQGVLFPRVALVFTKTRILSVKVNTLACFLSMVKTLDQSSLTQKLVPLLAKIRTKEPAVMLATLDVHEAMGVKVDREAVATLVLPQLWTMSMGPLLNVTQFGRFMSVIRTLGERVEKEHGQYLRDSQRNEDRSENVIINGNSNVSIGGSVDFQTLVTSATGSSGASPPANASSKVASWEDEVWGSILDSGNTSGRGTPIANSSLSVSPVQTQSLPGTPKPFTPSLGSTAGVAKPVLPPPPRNTNTGSYLSQPPGNSLSMQSLLASTPAKSPLSFGSIGTSPLQPNPAPSNRGLISPPPTSNPKPNYNIAIPSSSTPSIPSIPPTLGAAFPMMSSNLQPMRAMSPPMSSTVLTPNQPSWGTPLQPKKVGKDDWGDFDPLK